MGEALSRAIIDYRYLLDSGYPVSGSLSLVGDRYRLGKAERTILFRGILRAGDAIRIAGRLLPRLPVRSSLAIDGYNILFTVHNYLRGVPLFIGTDGLLRDAGGSHGRFSPAIAFDAAVASMVAGIRDLDPERVTIVLDAPVSGSFEHAGAIRESCRAYGLRAEVVVVPSADPVIKEFPGDAVASSDSAIALASVAPIFDLARYILEGAFGAAFPDLGRA
ncbi:MAG: DUF434 domain-containing protein [Spirochaetae bacterium HGW-Spirochaetae-3]|jgi:hypothetical protein|nr:MAG: DUF434 domain-containing protein [Spirochaetae bacterium HGW-Spirochaetae-3]